MAGFNKDDKGKWIEKDPGASLDYSIDWSVWLQAGETIASATWSVPSGITKSSEGNSTTVATVWLAGGVVGREYAITSKITTSAGRQDERSFRIIVRNR